MHCCEAALSAGARQGDHVGQQHGEGLVADDVARAPDGMAEAERRLLAGEAGRAGGRQIGHQGLVFLVLAAALQRVFQLVGDVEMIFDHRLVAAGDEDEMLDAGLARLVDAHAAGPGGRRRSAFPSARPWWRAESACRGRRPGRQLCECAWS